MVLNFSSRRHSLSRLALATSTAIYDLAHQKCRFFSTGDGDDANHFDSKFIEGFSEGIGSFRAASRGMVRQFGTSFSSIETNNNSRIRGYHPYCLSVFGCWSQTSHRSPVRQPFQSAFLLACLHLSSVGKAACHIPSSPHHQRPRPRLLTTFLLMLILTSTVKTKVNYRAPLSRKAIQLAALAK